MKIVRGLHNWQNMGPCVAAIGNFDGVHVGHQQLLAKLCAQAQQYQLPSVVITFEPPPSVYFQQQHAPARLMTLTNKLAHLQQYPIDIVLCLAFNQKLASVTAEDFVKQILLDRLSVKFLNIGDDFHFGYQRRGNVTLLQRMAKQHGFSVQQLAPYTMGKHRVSSTMIRHCLQQGQLSQAKRLLGKYYCISGRVIHGEQRGRLLGFPTANVAVENILTALNGVYVVQVAGITSALMSGVANIGQRPTVNGKRRLLEVHLFDFNGNIYGKKINVQFLHKLRDEQRFASIEHLQQQIGQDKKQAQQYFADIPVVL